ncbi:toll/interleukin-1 receptor domain-containing protein [Rhodococcus sp. NPDC003322]
MELSTATAFWSYAHADNDATGGHVRELAKQVAGSYQLETGEKLTLFVDRDEESGLKWGDEWQEKISSTIAGTTFFIPIISPSYLNSENCRNEFLEFWSRASESNLGELLLPILYADVDLSADSSDEICRIVEKIQFLDWRETRLEEFNSKIYKTELAKIGRRLKEVATIVELKPESVAEEESSDDEPGLFELLASAEAAMESLQGDMDRVKLSFGLVGATFEGISQAPARSSMSAHLSDIVRVANALKAPTKEFDDACKILEGKTREIDSAVVAMVEFSEDPILGAANSDAIAKMHENFVEMRDQMAGQIGEFASMRRQMSSLGRMSRAMKAPSRNLQAGFLSLESAMAIISGWAEATAKVVGKGD